MTEPDPAAAAETYFDAGQNRDFDRLATVLAEDATFRGPLGSAGSGAECLQGLRAMSQLVTGIDVQHRFVDGADVLTWFELHTEHAPPAPTANWMHVENGRITRIRVTFDPRAILDGAG